MWRCAAKQYHLFYSAPQCSDCKRCTSYDNSVRLSVRPSVTRRYCVKPMARSTVRFALSDSKMCLVLYKPKNIPQGWPLPPEIFPASDLPPPEGSEFWHILPCSASTKRVRKGSSIMLNKNSTWDFQRAINQGSTPPLTSSKWDKLPKFVVFWAISTIKDEKSAEKFHYIKILSSSVVAQSNCLSSGINILAGGSSVPLISERKGSDPH